MVVTPADFVTSFKPNAGEDFLMLRRAVRLLALPKQRTPEPSRLIESSRTPVTVGF
jgi:hypothetical protein